MLDFLLSPTSRVESGELKKAEMNSLADKTCNNKIFLMVVLNTPFCLVIKALQFSVRVPITDDQNSP